MKNITISIAKAFLFNKSNRLILNRNRLLNYFCFSTIKSDKNPN